jgi:hypothetical protein
VEFIRSGRGGEGRGAARRDAVAGTSAVNQCGADRPQAPRATGCCRTAAAMPHQPLIRMGYSNV